MKLEGQFQIATPCHENWEKMTPEVQGRFCDSCKKCVVDFTKMNKVEIKNVYDKEQGDVCGRMNISQLQVKRRPAIRASLGRIGKRLRAIQAFALALLFVIGIQTMTEAKAQKPIPVKMGKIAYVPTKASVHGTVQWDSGTKAEGQSVEIYQGKELVHTTTTNSSGSFSFPSLKPGNYTLKVKPTHGYANIQEIRLKERESKAVVMILEDMVLLGDTMYVPDEENFIEEVIEFQEKVPEKILFIQEKPVEKVSLETQVVSPETEKTTLLPSTDALKIENAVQIHLFPNPTNGLLNFSYHPESKLPLELTVIDIDGKEMLKQKWEESATHVHQIQMQTWAAGTYYLVFRAGKSTFHEKVLKF